MFDQIDVRLAQDYNFTCNGKDYLRYMGQVKYTEEILPVVELWRTMCESCNSDVLMYVNVNRFLEKHGPAHYPIHALGVSAPVGYVTHPGCVCSLRRGDVREAYSILCLHICCDHPSTFGHACPDKIAYKVSDRMGTRHVPRTRDLWWEWTPSYSTGP